MLGSASAPLLSVPIDALKDVLAPSDPSAANPSASAVDGIDETAA